MADPLKHLPYSIPENDRKVLADWAEHGIPLDQSTVDHAAKLIGSLVGEIHQWAAIVDQLLAGHCDACAATISARLEPTLFDPASCEVAS